MKLIKKYNNCDFLGLIDNKTVIWYKDHIEFGNLSIPTQEGDDYVIWHGSKAVSRKRNGKRMLLFDKEFAKFVFRTANKSTFNFVNKCCDNSRFTIYHRNCLNRKG